VPIGSTADYAVSSWSAQLDMLTVDVTGWERPHANGTLVLVWCQVDLACDLVTEVAQQLGQSAFGNAPYWITPGGPYQRT
jgi:hypothetical protein